MIARDILAQKGNDVVTIGEGATLDEAIATLAAKNIGAVLVMAPGDAVRGILSERDVIRVLGGAPTGFRETPVSEVMTKSVMTLGPTATIDELLRLMSDNRFRHVPICEGDRLLGLVSIGDVVRAKIALAESEAAALKEYITAG